MKTSKVTYIGNLRTEAVHLQSGTNIITDAPTDNFGKGEAFSPTDLLATSLATCMITTIGIAAKKKSMDLQLDNTQLLVTKIMESNPRRVSEIIVEFQLPPNNYSKEEIAFIENAAKTCPVALSLNAELKQTLVFNY